MWRRVHPIYKHEQVRQRGVYQNSGEDLAPRFAKKETGP